MLERGEERTATKCRTAGLVARGRSVGKSETQPDTITPRYVMILQGVRRKQCPLITS